MKIIIGVIFLVFAILIGMQELEKSRALFYASLNSEYLTNTIIDEEENKITITLTGNVKKPGAYLVEKNTFLEDVLTKAGGCLENSDYLAFNIYLLLEQDSDIYIPQVNAFQKVSLNQATIAEFQTIPGIGITLATRMVEFRQTNGTYRQLEDVKKIAGIKQALFNNIKDYLIL